MPLAAFPRCFLGEMVTGGSMTLDRWIEMVAAELCIDDLAFYKGFAPQEDDDEVTRLRGVAEAHGLQSP